MNQFIKVLFVLYCFVGISGCEGFLDEKPSKSLVVPDTLEDIQALLDGDALMNIDAFTLFLQSDDFELEAPGVAQLIDWQRNAVFWKGEIDSPTGVTAEYFNIYRKIFVAHFAIEELEKFSTGKSQIKDDLMGQALFYRAYGYFTLAQLFMPDYSKGKDMDVGILPLRSVSQLDVAVPLAAVSQIYSEIVKNLEQALTLLPDKAKYQTRPSKVATHGLLSRVNLAMGDYDKALVNALAALNIQSELMDYNSIDPVNTYPIPFLNEEIVFNGIQSAYSFSFSTNLLVNSEIYQSYDSMDLRKVLYFTINRDGLPNFTGSYNGNFELFSGIAVDELILTAAECLVRAGEVQKGMEYLNRLLETRWVTGSFVPFETSSSQEALEIILFERRKSLLFRSTRWLDLRRLSNEPSFHKPMAREAGGFSGKLDLSQTAYALKIPARELDFEGAGQ
ncbi:RagB/SusD family nutrient uptake outer membrane protein [Algoriphagus boritolerans]|uniref:SusD family protein n=1 Tax=Algoriphagus boritolerans DSM 17298 = JCM 18970 TaxID=1120964 RepID=A0A1H5XGQ0_9BACT|nr:RagB/SusD family nutrient uptake outer membrane protein [Algoriphagus boritolerans]SEG10889.1 SusD family protein [Algoriphagus boritolerans DSM 17298 = JCM 18970]